MLRRGLAVVLVGVALVGVIASAHARSSLWRKLRDIRANRAAIQRQLREVKREQRETQSELAAAQQALEQARARLRKARAQLRHTRKQLEVVRRRLEVTEDKLVRHRRAFSERILALYRSNAPTPLAVVLNVSSFEEMANRARFVSLVAEQDQKLLRELVALEKQLEARHAELRQLEARQAAHQAEVHYQAAQVAAQERRTERALQAILADRQRLEQELAEMEAESRRIEAMLAALQRGTGGRRYAGAWSGSLLRPVSGPVVSGFGMRFHPILHYYRMHTGVDMHAPYGAPVRAADKGMVVFAGWRGGYGKCVIIDHGSGVATLYAHLSGIAVGEGQVVSRGEVIGAVGSTGLSTGPHLHFEVRRYGAPVNPLSF
ncbi:MAG: peptidoglycan DD-metalloendopeptidase family protein [Armatimonadetes bacterium]|nr:peptidoglycan DD-metalloendopeptidase family protein [Armatimonadota bacterium]